MIFTDLFLIISLCNSTWNICWQHLRTDYRSGIIGWRTLLHRCAADVLWWPTRWQHFLREMTSWPPSWKYDVKSKIRLRLSMRIHLKNVGAEFHPDPIWNDGALRFWGRSPQQEQEQEEKRTTTRTTRWVAIWDQFMIQSFNFDLNVFLSQSLQGLFLLYRFLL